MISCSRDSEEFKEIVGRSEGFAVDALWLNVCDIYSHANYEDQKRIFLQVLRYLLLDSRVYLAAKKPLTGTLEEQIAEFESAWPAEEDIHDDIFWATKAGECWVPGGLVWVYEDGHEVPT
ncbi:MULTISPECIES: DUF596 domain-containing protein [Pseudomonas]|uniref:DUF596 domain-containing protein n=1 Tax=Pseudomonas vlassakiae TaxID=485888 RepID=A0A923GMB0_9PSED|nr:MULTISPECIES: DUF596 domain-containing protein [Pseudomonas]MBV4542852.1 DUF596 domain-containing protein [Pseudomonas vlassakiae]